MLRETASSARLLRGRRAHMFWQRKAQEEPSVLKSGRRKCYEARDRFYECSDELGRPGEAVPEQCKALRQAYEDSCAASWVRSKFACRFVTFALLALQAAAARLSLRS